MMIVIKGARLFDGTGRAAVEKAAVVIEDKRIRAVGPENQVEVPGDATIIEAQGRTVLPGLTDLHLYIVSLTPPERHSSGITQRTIASSIIRGVANGRRCLNAGVTTVRVDSCGHYGIFALKEAIATGLVDGPRLFVPGRSICMTGGHGWDGGNYQVDGADEVRKAAREVLREGADWVKLMATGGAGSPTERVEDNQMTLEEITAGVEEAHKKGKYAFAHVSCAEGARNCIAAGIDSIEHGLFLEEDIVRDMEAKGIFLVPTLGVYHRLVELGEEKKVPEFMYRKALQVREVHAKSFQMAMKARVKIATGTDSGANWYPPGESLHYELEMMHRTGMSPKDCLIAATSRAAECLRMTDDLGTLETGKLADVLIVEGDPLAKISDIRHTWLVLKEGRVVFRK